MAVHYQWGRKGALRKLLFRFRRALPRSLKLRVWQQTHAQLASARPLEERPPFFSSIELETRTRCNSTCSFCAASIHTDQRPDIYMPDDLYAKIIGELAERDYAGAIKFFVNNEPLLDKRTADFVRMAKVQVPNCSTEVHTNGLKLNPRNGRELMEAGLDVLVINNYSDEGKMHRGVRAFLDEVAPDFQDRDIRFHLRDLNATLLNRGGTAPSGILEKAPLALPCLLPFDEMVVTADGRVTICCQDHSFSEAVGNVKSDSLEAIWYSPGFQKLRRQLAQGDRSGNPLCKVCDFRGYKEEHLNRSQSRKNRAVGALLHESS